MNKTSKAILKAAILSALVFAICVCIISCDGKKKHGELIDSSFDVVYTKSDAVKRQTGDVLYTIYGVKGENADGTLTLVKYNAASPDFGRTITIQSNSGTDIESVKLDDETQFDFGKLRENADDGMTDLEFFMSQIGKKYNGKLIYFEMELEGDYIGSARFFSEYYR